MAVDQSKTFYVDGIPIIYQQIEDWYAVYKRNTPKNKIRLSDPYFSEASCWFIAKEIVRGYNKNLNIFNVNNIEDIHKSPKQNNTLVKSDYMDDYIFSSTDDIIKKAFEDMEREYKEKQEELKFRREQERLRQQQNAEFWKYQNKYVPPPTYVEQQFNYRKILNVPENITLTETIIKIAYFKQAKIVHPDHGGSNKKFEELCKARESALISIGIIPKNMKE